MPDIGYAYAPALENHDFVVVRPYRHHVVQEGKAFERVEWYNWFSLDSLARAIHDTVIGDTLLSQLANLPFDRGFRNFDPKRVFKTKEELLKVAGELHSVHAIWLPEWGRILSSPQSTC